MWKFLIIVLLGTSESLGFQLADSYSCNGSATCIPLSECEVIKNMVEVDESLDAKSFFCGYFHEPYVCCDKNCYTPNGHYGQAVPLNACIHLKSNEQSGDRRKRKFLAESYLNKTHVCCNEGEDSYRAVPPAPVGARNSSTPKPLGSLCVTPNGEIAVCKHVNDCEAYKGVSKETDQNFRFMNDSFCGLWEEPMVCCGDVSDYKENYKENVPDVEVCGVWDTIVYPTIAPWSALIKSSSKSCVGAVISQKYVLATVKCTGENYKELDIKIGRCINDESYKNCKFQVSEFKIFPLYMYLHTEDIGMVLLKLNLAIKTEDFMPVCLPNSELALWQEIDIIGLERVGANWKGTKTSTMTLSNDLCRNAMKIDFERIVCFQGTYFCSKRSPLLNFALQNENERWLLEGLFNKDDCYGADYFNTIYVYRFLPWIYSNLK